VVCWVVPLHWAHGQAQLLLVWLACMHEHQGSGVGLHPSSADAVAAGRCLPCSLPNGLLLLPQLEGA
jgi:hypothetical protein